MPPQKNYAEEYSEKFSEFRDAIQSYDNTPENAKILAEKYGEIRQITLTGRQIAKLKIDEDLQDKAFTEAAEKFGKDFLKEVKKVPKVFAQSRIQQFREEIRELANSGVGYDKDQLARRYFDVMRLAGKSLDRKKLDGVKNMYHDVRKLIGKERADLIFEAHRDYYEMAPGLLEERKQEEEQQKEAARQQRLEEENAQLEEEQEVDEERYYNLRDANATIKKAFEKKELSEHLNALLAKKEADSKAIDKICANKTDEERETIEQSLNDDVAFLNDLKKYTKRLCEYGQGDDMRPIDGTVKTIQNRFPTHLNHLFSAPPTEKPGSVEHKDRLEMIQACGSMLVNAQRFVNAAAEIDMPLKRVEVKDPMATTRNILKKFSTELDRIPKNDDNTKLFTSFKSALKRAADGSGSLENLYKASMKYFNARRGRLFRPFTEVGRHRLDIADHVVEFLKDVKYETLEAEAERKAEAQKAAEAKKVAPSQANLSPEERGENGWAARQNMQNGRREEFIAELQALGFTREEIEEQKAAFESLNNGNNNLADAENAPANEDQLQQQQGGLQMGNFG